MNTLLSLLALFLLLLSCEVDLDLHEDSTSFKTEMSDINHFKNYTKIEASGATDLVIHKGKQHQIVLKGNRKHFKYLAFSQDGKRLICETRSDNIENLDVTIHITLPNVEAIDASGASEVELTSFGKIDDLHISLSGAGSFSATGKTTEVKNLAVDLSGAGEVDAEQLIAQKVKVHVSGAGEADVHAVEELDASVSGVGSVNYSGQPKVRQHVSGIGSISKK